MQPVVTEILIAVASGLILLAVQYLIDKRGQWSTSTSSSGTATQVSTTITVNQTINNNIDNSAMKSKGSSDEKDVEPSVYFLWALALVIATATFVSYYEYAVAALFGIALALTVAALRLLGNSRQITGITDQVRRSAVEVLAIVAATIVTAFGILFTTRGPLTVGGTRQPLPSSPSDGNSLEQFLAPIGDQVKWLFGNSVSDALPFAAMMFAALAVVAILAFAGATTLVRWQAYLKFATAVSMNPQSVQRAHKFLELTWPRVVGTMVICVIAIALSLGWVFDLWHLASQQNLSFPV